MKRSDILKAAPVLLLAGCTKSAGGVVLPNGSSQQQLAKPPPCKNWMAQWGPPMGKPGGHSVASVYKSDDQCDWHLKGHIDVEIETKFGTGAMWFAAAGQESPHYDINRVQYIFGPGSKIDWFNDWLVTISDDGRTVTVNKGSKIVAISESNKGYTITTITFFSGGSQQYQYQQSWSWSGAHPRGIGHDISDGCIGSLLAFFGSTVVVAVMLILATVPSAGILDVIILAGVSAEMLGQRLVVQKECGY